MNRLEQTIGYRFHDPGLLLTALTHSSYANEHRLEHAECYERLEFLGDSILGVTAAEFLYRWEPALPEGQMTRIRAGLVCEESLHRAALKLGIGPLMRLGRGAELSGERKRPAILADMVEAIIAALYLDGGMEAAKELIFRFVLSDAPSVIEQRTLDHKTALQELVQQKKGGSVRYELTGESGPDHDKRFSYVVFVNGIAVGEGTGRSKKEAEQIAAASAMRNLTETELREVSSEVTESGNAEKLQFPMWKS